MAQKFIPLGLGFMLDVPDSDIQTVSGDFTLTPNETSTVVQRWLHNFGQCGKWNFCLTAGTLVPANQEHP